METEVVIETNDGAESPGTPVTPTDLLNKEVPLSDYYTIAIMAESPIDNNDMITSFANPNYTLNNPDALNSNLSPSNFFHDNHIYEDPDNMVTTTTPLLTQDKDGTDGRTDSLGRRNRKKYADLDLSAMGVKLTSSDSIDLNSEGDVLSPLSVDTQDSDTDSAVTSPAGDSIKQDLEDIVHGNGSSNKNDMEEDDIEPYGETRPSKGFLGYYASLEMSAKRREEEKALRGENCDTEEEETNVTQEQKEKEKRSQSFEDKAKDINSPDSNDSGIQADVQHIQGPLNDDLYAVVSKTKKNTDNGSSQPDQANKESAPASEDEGETIILPPGWEKHEDEDGPYYWHIRSGTIQREPPSPVSASEIVSPRPTLPDTDIQKETCKSQTETTPSEENSSSSNNSSPSAKDAKLAQVHKSARHKLELTRRQVAADLSQPIRFAVRSLGWVRIAEEDLTPERSSKAVNKCIMDLSLGRNDINDVVGRWGDGKDLYMDLDNESLALIDPQDMTMLNVQPVQTIRVWGVGRDNGRDFAYVARDRTTRRHMCHVFRCDTPAREIANTLRDICKRIMLERSLQAAGSGVSRMAVNRPNNLPNLDRAGSTPNGQKLTFHNLYASTSFPTPMEEPKKTLRCHYLGTAQVSRPSGVELLNSAIQKVHAKVPPEKWVFVNVGVAPSTVTITEHGKPENVLAECRVRFLSFMGIAMHNVKMCGFIMHAAQDQFVAHVFHCEPSAGAVCKTIEAACKLRYQKCLDAHPSTPDKRKTSNTQSGKPVSAGTTLRSSMQNVFCALKKKVETHWQGNQSSS